MKITDVLEPRDGSLPQIEDPETPSVVIAFVMSAVALLYGGYVLAWLWLWFVEPAFGLSMPGVGTCAGLLTVWTFFTYKHEKLAWAKVCDAWWAVMLQYTITLIAGFLIHRISG